MPAPVLPTVPVLPEAVANFPEMQAMVAAVRACVHCAPVLPPEVVGGPRPIISLERGVRILLISQAPGRLAHTSVRPWNDPGGRRLRQWLGVTEDVFYNPFAFGIYPMGFCYPGKGTGGDLPPRPECALRWRPLLEAALSAPENQPTRPPLRILIGNHAQAYYLPRDGSTLTQRLQALHQADDNGHAWQQGVVLPHPSPRNRIFLARNPWIESELIPRLQTRVAVALQDL